MSVLTARSRTDLVLLHVTILQKGAAQQFPITWNAFSQKLATVTNAKLFKYFLVDLRPRRRLYPRQVRVRRQLPALSRFRPNVQAAYREILAPTQILHHYPAATQARIPMTAHSVMKSAARVACPSHVPSRLPLLHHAARMKCQYSADLLSVSGQTASRLFPIRIQRRHQSIYRRALTIIGCGMCLTMAV